MMVRVLGGDTPSRDVEEREVDVQTEDAWMKN